MKNKYIASLFKCFLYISCIMLVTACAKEEGLDTNQLGGSEVKLVSFGPSPIARGGELRIIGTNLNQVESVTIPGASAITDIKRISATEIRVTVPQTAAVGKIVLKAGSKTITSITELTYNEPISISNITPLEAMPGVTAIKIEGEYLNLIKEIIFVNADMGTNHILQANFVSQSRQAIEVVVPKTAQSGKIIVSNGADLVTEGEDPGIPIWVYSDQDLIVTLPAFTKLTPQPVKPGSELTITGTNLDLVKLLKFGASNIEVSDFTINSAKTEIKAVVPKETQFDATTKKGDVKFVAFSGVEAPANLGLVAPAITSITPVPAKNTGILTIEGTDLDLVTTVVFAGNIEGTVQFQSAAKIEVEIPAAAAEGTVVLNTYSGQTAEKAYTLVKPAISSIAPLSLTAGDNITITGTDLDLVNEVIFKSGTGTVSVTLTEAPNSSSFTIRTPFTAASGTISLKTANGTIVISTQSLTITEASLPIVTDMPIAVKPGDLMTLKGINLDKVTRIVFVYSNGTEIAATRFLPDASGQAIQVYAPATKGSAIIRLYAGDDYVETSTIKIMMADPVIDPSLLIFDFDNSSKMGATNWSNVGEIKSGDGVDGQFYEVTSAAPVNGGWVWLFASNAADFIASLPQVSGISNYVLKFDVRLRNDVPITSSYCDLQFHMGSAGDITISSSLKRGNVFTTDGEWTTISIPLTELGLSDPTPNSGDWGFIMNQGSPAANFVGLCFDNIRYERISE